MLMMRQKLFLFYIHFKRHHRQETILKNILFQIATKRVWNNPKRTWRMIWSCVEICISIWNAPKIEGLSFFVSKLITCFLKMPNFFMHKIFEVPHLIMKIEKWGISNISSRAFWENICSILKQKKNRKWKLEHFDFGAFLIEMHMSIHDPIILHVRFGAFVMSHFILVIWYYPVYKDK